MREASLIHSLESLTFLRQAFINWLYLQIKVREDSIYTAAFKGCIPHVAFFPGVFTRGEWFISF